MTGLKALAVTGPLILAGTGDWELTSRNATGQVVESFCAKDRTSCELAVDAIRKGWLSANPLAVIQQCQPRPQCFSPASECIQGHSCGPRQ